MGQHKNTTKDILVKRMYKKNISEIIALNNLTYVQSKSEHFIFEDPSSIVHPTESLVVGGACIDRCESLIENLGINFYLDILTPINYALQNNLSPAIFVDTPIEVSWGSDTERARWMQLSDQVETFIKNLGRVLEIDIGIVRREKGAAIIDEMLTRTSFSDQELKGLYDMVPSSKNAFFSDDLLLHFRRSIISYLPEFLSQYFEKTINQVIVVEELSQCKAIGKAQNINPHIIPQIYLDMPSISCKNRMHRSPHGKIGIFSKIENYETDPLFNNFIKNISLPAIFNKLSVDDFSELTTKLTPFWEKKNE